MEKPKELEKRGVGFEVLKIPEIFIREEHEAQLLSLSLIHI